MKQGWRDKIRTITPYIPGEQSNISDLIKLNANENPYPPAPGVQKILQTFDISRLRRYPDANGASLRQAIATRFSLTIDQVFLGNGSDDVLALCFQAFFSCGQPILFPDLTYSFYPVWCDLFRIPFQTIPLDENFRIQPNSYAIPNGGVIIPNPNAPTGIGENLHFIESLLSANPDSIVVIDEAYIDFGGVSCVSLLKKYDNLVIVQTMSKSRSLAGLRVGYALACPALIACLEAVKNAYNSYPLDMLALELGCAAIEDESYFLKTCAKVIATREDTIKQLHALGFEVLPSQANFVLMTHPKKHAREIFEILKEHHIFVRHFNQARIENYLRVTIGTDAQMQRLLDVLQTILE